MIGITIVLIVLILIIAVLIIHANKKYSAWCFTFLILLTSMSYNCFTFCCMVDEKEHEYLSGKHPFTIPQQTAEYPY